MGETDKSRLQEVRDRNDCPRPKTFVDPDEIWDKDSLKSDEKVEEHHADP